MHQEVLVSLVCCFTKLVLFSRGHLYAGGRSVWAAGALEDRWGAGGWDLLVLSVSPVSGHRPHSDTAGMVLWIFFFHQ